MLTTLTALASVLLVVAPLMAQADNPHRTDGQVTLRGGRKLAYKVEMGRVPIRDGGSDEVRANMFFVAYRVPSAQPRPVIFFWNGGPGSSTSTLHLQSVGPRQLAPDGRVLDFGDTALTAADLVFVDAVGTGFSRAAKPEFADQFYQMRGDVAAFTDFVRAWRLLYGAERSSIYLAGESWGSFRAGAVALGLEKRGIKVGGVIAISGRPGLPNSMLDTRLRALRTVQQSLAAQKYGLLSPDLGTDPATLQEKVRGWVVTTYVPALERIDTLTSPERDTIARELSGYIGLPEREIDRKTLMVFPQQFLEGLLRDRGQVLDVYDMTRTREQAPKQNLQSVEAYLRHELGYVTDLAYIQGDSLSGFSPDGGAIKGPGDLWDYQKGFFDGYARPNDLEVENEQRLSRGEPPRGQETPDTASAMAIDHDLRLLIADGLYDSRSTCAISDETIARQAPELRPRIEAHCYQGGHIFYFYPAAQRQFSEDLQKFVTRRPAR